jgi:hypothetical protein
VTATRAAGRSGRDQAPDRPDYCGCGPRLPDEPLPERHIGRKRRRHDLQAICRPTRSSTARNTTASPPAPTSSSGRYPATREPAESQPASSRHQRSLGTPWSPILGRDQLTRRNALEREPDMGAL